MERPKLNISSLLSNICEPVLLPHFLKWDILNWDLEKWADVIHGEDLEFRYGLNAKTNSPQWEKSTPTIRGNFEDIVNFTNSERWLYFDYKYLNQCLLNAKELRENINFGDLGLENITANESTIWIGTKGAHTPCHVDTYGCNVVAQIHGQKLWLLFKPEEDLKATRVPYEESTIYSRLNFFSPTNISDFKDVHNGKLIVLNPGDVLIIPNKWWHYVESLDKAISINTWLPLNKDHVERKKECLLQLLIGSLMNNADENFRTSFLNPNSHDILDHSFNSGVNFLAEILKIKDVENNLCKNEKEDQYNDFLETQPLIKKIDNMTDATFMQFLEKQSTRFSTVSNFADEPQENLAARKIIHVITHPDVIDLILKKLNEN